MQPMTSAHFRAPSGGGRSGTLFSFLKCPIVDFEPLATEQLGRASELIDHYGLYRIRIGHTPPQA